MNTDVKIFFELMFLYSWNNCHKVESLNHLEHSQTFLGPFFHLLSHPPLPPSKKSLVFWYWWECGEKEIFIIWNLGSAFLEDE